jgi:hypothetical protein
MGKKEVHSLILIPTFHHSLLHYSELGTRAVQIHAAKLKESKNTEEEEAS